MNKEKFCGMCGKELTYIPFRKKKYNTETGEEILKPICMNMQCVAGCEEHGHQWSEWSGHWYTSNRERNCYRCGDQEWSGFY